MIIFWRVFSRITRQTVSRFFVNMFWIGLTKWVLNFRGEKLSIRHGFLAPNTLLLRKCVQELFPLNYFPWNWGQLLQQTECRNKSTGLEQEFLVCGRWRHHAENEKVSFAVWNVLNNINLLCITNILSNKETVEIKSKLCQKQQNIQGLLHGNC